MLPVVEDDVKRITVRARCFMLTLAFRHLVVGGICISIPHEFTATSYDVIQKIAPLWAWGLLMILVGTAGVGAAWVGRETPARTVLVMSAGITAGWMAGFVGAGLIGQLDAPPLPVVWAALTAKDLIASAIPLRTPLEDAAKRRGLME